MAPEQAVGSPVNLRADLYAWGVMAYEVLAGGHPFARHTTAQQLIAAHITERPVSILDANSAIPAPLAQAVMRCLEKDPAQRPASANELLTALDTASTPDRAALGAGVTSAPVVGAPSVRTRRWLIGVGTAVIVLAGGAWLANRFGGRANSAGAVTSGEKSLAVIPFEWVGGDTANAYFAEGVADELTIALAKLPGLRLAGRSSVARFKGKGASAQDIGSALNVGAVLEGTVRRAGNQVRVTAQLSNAADGLVLWSDSYDREAKDVFALQDDITNNITSALRVRLSSSGASAVAGIATTNPEAHDLYLRGLYLLRRRGAGLVQAAQLFEQAIAKDSNFARAHAALASALLTEPYYLPVRVADVRPRAFAAAERAVRLDPTLSDAHMALGIAHFHAYEFAQAEAEARRAVALDPNSAEAEYRLGFVLLSIGRVAESIPELERAKAIDPLYPLVAAYVGYAYALTGQYDAGIAEGRRAVELDSSLVANFTLLIRAYRAAGRTAEAVDLARRVTKMTDDVRRLGIVAYTLGMLGTPGETRPIIARLEALPPNVARRDAGLAFAYLGVGDTARALAAMERAAAADGDLLFSIVPTDPTFDPVRASPRFADVLRKLNFDVALITRPRDAK
jgi:serine/threonine-protein kinase